ncbi:MAG: signal recognition particle protein, partial [Firmicutes bacterium]|nr:signal recognition particle protein [Bacillota bacterium]
SDILGMIPGMGKIKQLKNMEVDDSELVRIEAIINSMTPQERHQYNIINGSRRRRIAGGSGTTVQDVNALMNRFEQARTMMKRMMKGKHGMRDLMKTMR